MSSKEDILKRIHANTRQQYEMPDLSLNAIVYEDKLNTFIDVLKAAGGEAYVMQPEDDLNVVIQKFYPDAQRIGSNLKDITCATFNPDELEDPRELNGTDVSVVKGEFGVAENAAVWLFGCRANIGIRLYILFPMLWLSYWTGRNWLIT